jgi:hypothetical protein
MYNLSTNILNKQQNLLPTHSSNDESGNTTILNLDPTLSGNVMHILLILLHICI